jgi:hypothetical protein
MGSYSDRIQKEEEKRIKEEGLLYERSKIFIELLRKEASEAKACATQYSLQSLAFGTVAIGVIINYSKDNTLAALAVIPVILALMSVLEIIVYKYEVANRSYGFEQYLQSINELYKNQHILPIFEQKIAAWKFVIKNEHWERCYFIWKIIHPTLISSYYHVNYHNTRTDILNLYRFKLRKNIEKLGKKDIWFMVRGGSGSEKPLDKNKSYRVDYHTGSYLRTILWVTQMVQFMLLLPLLIAVEKNVRSFWKEVYDIILKLNLSVISKYTFENKEFFCLVIVTILLILFYSLRFLSNYRLFGCVKKILKADNIVQCCLLLALVIAILKNVIFSWTRICNFFFLIIQYARASQEFLYLVIIVLALILITILCIILGVRLVRRAKILENGINSIRTASLIWGIVFDIHHQCWQDTTREIQLSSMNNYEIDVIAGIEFERKYEEKIFIKVGNIMDKLLKIKDEATEVAIQS